MHPCTSLAYRDLRRDESIRSSHTCNYSVLKEAPRAGRRSTSPVYIALRRRYRNFRRECTLSNVKYWSGPLNRFIASPQAVVLRSIHFFLYLYNIVDCWLAIARDAFPLKSLLRHFTIRWTSVSDTNDRFEGFLTEDRALIGEGDKMEWLWFAYNKLVRAVKF